MVVWAGDCGLKALSNELSALGNVRVPSALSNYFAAVWMFEVGNDGSALRQANNNIYTCNHHHRDHDYDPTATGQYLHYHRP